MQIADRDTTHKWYRLIDNGVPQDKALDWLETEATSPAAPSEYLNAWAAHQEIGPVCNTGGLTVAECLVLKIYTDDEHQFFRRFNGDCRSQKWQPYIVITSLLHSALCKRRRRHGEKTVEAIRGVQYGASVKTDKGVCMPGFTSTTPSICVAEEFGPTKLFFMTTTGGSIESFSVFPHEKEILIGPFQCFTVEKQTSSRLVFKSSIEMTSPFLASPLIRGALLGAVVGNCLGAPYEFDDDPLTIEELLQTLHDLESDTAYRGHSRYTADVAMTFALADSLTRAESLNIENLMRCFVQTLIDNPDRGYSDNTVQVFTELHEQTKDDDHFAPAKRLFNGQGSKGNGGAMRIAPLAIYYFFEKEHQLNEYVKHVTALTHNHTIAIHGAILQATAVQYALMSSFYGGRSDDFGQLYIDELIKRMKAVEFLNMPFSTKLGKIKDYLAAPPSEEAIRTELGTGITADESVPTAIYCFLRGMKPIPGIPSDRTEFERTVIYAISLGGDTDTIASMAGAIAGAYYGQDAVTQRWRDLCETKAIYDAKRYANKMIAQLFWDGEY